MEVHLNPELERKLTELAAKTGLAPERLLEEAVAAYRCFETGDVGLVAMPRR